MADGKFVCKLCGKEYGLGSGGNNRSKLHITRAKKHLERCTPKGSDSKEAKERLMEIVKTSLSEPRPDADCRAEAIWRSEDIIKQRIYELFVQEDLNWSIIDGMAWKALMQEMRPTFRCPNSEAIKTFDINKVKVKEDKKLVKHSMSQPLALKVSGKEVEDAVTVKPPGEPDGPNEDEHPHPHDHGDGHHGASHHHHHHHHHHHAHVMSEHDQ